MSENKKNLEITLDVKDEGKTIKAGLFWKGKHKKWNWRVGLTAGLLRAAGKVGGFNVTIER